MEHTNLDYIRAHQYLYYCRCQPVLTDYDYDKFGDGTGEDYKGGSDMESSYSDSQKALAMEIFRGKKPPIP